MEQTAEIIMNGQALDLFGSGCYMLETQNILKLGNSSQQYIKFILASNDNRLKSGTVLTKNVFVQ